MEELLTPLTWAEFYEVQNGCWIGFDNVTTFAEPPCFRPNAEAG